jgi:hypothetical protein
MLGKGINIFNKIKPILNMSILTNWVLLINWLLLRKFRNLKLFLKKILILFIFLLMQKLQTSL